jgi:hypothetical protein
MVIGRGRRREHTKDTSKGVTVTSPEMALSGSGPDQKYVLRMPGFFRIFFLVVVQ